MKTKEEVYALARDTQDHLREIANQMDDMLSVQDPTPCFRRGLEVLCIALKAGISVAGRELAKEMGVRCEA